MSEFLTIDKDNLLALGNNIDDYPGGVVLPIDKPYRWTSADVVRKVKFIAQKHFHKKNLKVGHAGTLDPLATGVLLVCLGKATKQAEALQAQQKEYIAHIELGATTPCCDMEKEIDQRYPFEHITREMVDEAVKGFIGEQDQIPPIFSAKLIPGPPSPSFPPSNTTASGMTKKTTRPAPKPCNISRSIFRPPSGLSFPENYTQKDGELSPSSVFLY